MPARQDDAEKDDVKEDDAEKDDIKDPVMPPPSDPAAADPRKALMDWHRRMGGDEIILETPINRSIAAPPPPPATMTERRNAPARNASARDGDDRRRSPPASSSASSSSSASFSPSASPSPRPPEPPPPSFSSASPSGVSEALSASVRACATLDALHAFIAAFDGCPLHETAKNTVFADGDPKADLMLIGEAPGRDEDIQGLPFVGRSGKLLDRILASVGLDRKACRITNILPWRPPGNRQPTLEEIETCRPFIERHIELVSPSLIAALGGVAAKSLTGSSQGIMKLRGRLRDYELNGKTYPLIASFHPAYLLRRPAEKRLVWHDFLMIRDALGNRTPTPDESETP